MATVKLAWQLLSAVGICHSVTGNNAYLGQDYTTLHVCFSHSSK